MVKQYKKKNKFEYRLQKLNNKKGEERNINRTELLERLWCKGIVTLLVGV